MLSSNWHVTLRLTVFEIFEVKWPQFRPKLRICGVVPPQKARRSVQDRYVPSCKISCRSVSLSPRHLQPDTEKNSKCSTNVWQAIATVTRTHHKTKHDRCRCQLLQVRGRYWNLHHISRPRVMEVQRQNQPRTQTTVKSAVSNSLVLRYIYSLSWDLMCRQCRQSWCALAAHVDARWQLIHSFIAICKVHYVDNV